MTLGACWYRRPFRQRARNRLKQSQSPGSAWAEGRCPWTKRQSPGSARSVTGFITSKTRSLSTCSLLPRPFKLPPYSAVFPSPVFLPALRALSQQPCCRRRTWREMH